ncbi:kelch motif family protein [Stylonychia lemnae]|uniref:Kelch motif family protein n=1 Tax=Stylonychia lemnae TaxID=5949 RepID=A0A078A159_STYLE|nr:kelch motif family protein [Stylonychia lemnae]|eukprot:CDW75223.1 kelch motif family protein [Stylonychia lemnae]
MLDRSKMSNSFAKSSFLQTLNSSPSQKWLVQQNSKSQKFLQPLSSSITEKSKKLGNEQGANNEIMLKELVQTNSFDPTQTLSQFYSTTYFSPTRTLSKLPIKPEDRLKKIKSISTLKQHELESTYHEVSLPVLRQIKNMKRNWGNERTMPEYEIQKGDLVYRSMMESCMMLDNNKKIQKDVEFEMNGNYKGKLDSFIKESKSGIWLKQKMPKIKQNPSIQYRKPLKEEEQDKKKQKHQTLDSQTSSKFTSKLNLQLQNALNDGSIPSNGETKRDGLNDESSLERDLGAVIDKVQEAAQVQKVKKERHVPNELGNPAAGKIDLKTLENYKCHWTIKESVNWKPCVRIGASLVNCGNVIMMFGGYNKIALQDLQYIDFKKAQWNLIEVTKGKRPIERFGHSVVFYKGNMIIFGGEQKYNAEIRMRETFNDLWAYNVVLNEFKVINAQNRLACEARKDHSMVQVGIHLLVYGGINSRGILIDDPMVYSFQTNEWMPLQIKGPSPGPLAFHQACAVYKKDRKGTVGFSLFRMGEIIAPQIESKIKTEGIYFFGGKSTNGFPQNQLRILKTGRVPLEWKEVKSVSKDPPPRYNHTLNFSEDQNLLVLFGGRCDFAAKMTNYQQILNDVWVLYLDNLCWYEVQCSGSVPRERFCHCATIVGTQLLIFGGLNSDNFLCSEIYCLELDPYHSKRMRADFNRKKTTNNGQFNIDYGSFKAGGLSENQEY